MLATIKIEVGVTSKVRQWNVPFKPTITYTQAFHYDTDTASYQNKITPIAQDVWNYVETQRAIFAEPTVHCHCWLDNITHPATSAGVVRLPKGHHDTALSNGEFITQQVLIDHLSAVCLNLKNTAKY